MELEPLTMGNEVIEFDMVGLGDDTVDDIHHQSVDEVEEEDGGDGEVEENHFLLNSYDPRSSHNSISGQVYTPQGDTNLEPYEGMEFESEEAAKAFYNSYARRVGFSTRVSMSRRSRRDGAIIQRSFVCAKEGFRVDKDKPARSDVRVKRPRAETRVGCKAMLVVKIQDSGRWVVSAFVREHNHELVPPDKVHCLRSHRHVSGSAKSLIDTLQGAGIGPSGIMSALIKEYGGISNVGFTERDCRNYMRSSRQRTLGGDTQHLLDYLRNKQTENSAFFYAVQGDEDQCMSNIFWADAKARANYTYFGDTVTFDTTYRSNRYRLPFAPFTGVNHHGQPVLFGCALLVYESEASFLWLFKTWLMAMSERPPVSITTDHDRVICLAVNQSQLRNLSLVGCLYLIDIISGTMSGYKQFIMIDASGSRLYLRDAFFAEMSITQRSDSINSYFDGYINASTTLQLFVKQYEKALESRYEKEVKADYDSINTAPALKTPSPMEKQVAELYSRKLVAKYGENHKAYTVSFNVREMKASCSCLMFEFSGLLCRHILTVFRVTNVLTLPSHYVLKRWTRNAKSGVILEEHASDFLSSSRESLTFRYSNLRHEALKYVDNGIQSLEIYNVSMNALQEAANKVALARKNGGKVPIANRAGREEYTHQGSQANNTNQNQQQGLEQPASGDDQDKKIQKLHRKLERAQRKCEVYRANLLSVLKDIEEQKLQLSIKVQNIKLGMKD
ncbi:PROTEIN FAR1-RELATED SEQUENCE 5-LIKE [Salix koriyanagi]|uniref:Protein FAR1-RELATED SEQUENCE n=1 Tax=Salix koriyanagi TaxID=2511006 RepID=A0A9Q0UD22_9ROSI|nr:PROTEIN FAR1-RELATED SEQUENCE 5-LIKE [Salix koriyanagi]